MKDSEKMDQQAKELTLLLLYINSWLEKDMGLEFRRSWKGYDFGALNDLAEERMITDSRRSKSVGITDKGEKRAKELMEKYLKHR